MLRICGAKGLPAAIVVCTKQVSLAALPEAQLALKVRDIRNSLPAAAATF
jgi:hypothetical protein